MKSSASESICAANAVKYKRGKFFYSILNKRVRVFNSDFSPRHEQGEKSIKPPNKPICSELTHPFEASVAFSSSVIFSQIEMTPSWEEAQFCSLAPQTQLSSHSNAHLIANLHSINLNGKPDLPFPAS